MLMLAYPFLIYFGLARFQARAMALVLLAVVGLRMALMRGGSMPAGLLAAAGVMGTVCLAVFLMGDQQFFLYYPVLMSLTMCALFAVTLNRPPSMIERFARIAEPDLPDQAIGYCRKVTIVWCGFFVANASVALWTIRSGDIKLWTLYNGLLSYLIMGLLFAVEYAVRTVFRRRLGV